MRSKVRPQRRRRCFPLEENDGAKNESWQSSVPRDTFSKKQKQQAANFLASSVRVIVRLAHVPGTFQSYIFPLNSLCALPISTSRWSPDSLSVGCSQPPSSGGWDVFSTPYRKKRHRTRDGAVSQLTRLDANSGSVVRSPVADVGTAHPEDHVFGNVCGMVGNAFQVARDQQHIERRPGRIRL